MKQCKLTFPITLLFISLTLGCGGVSPQALREGPLSDSGKPQILLSNIDRERAIGLINDVMASSGFAATSQTSHLLVYDKVMDSHGSQSFWGRGRTVRVSFSLAEDGKDIKIIGNISGIVTTNPSVLGSLSRRQTPGSQRTVDLMGKENYRTFLNELLEKIRDHS